MKNNSGKTPPDFADRLVSGFLCALMIVATLGVYLFLAFMRLGRWSESLYRLGFSEVGFVIIAVSFAAGFLAGPERLATGMSILWGTHPMWKDQRWSARAIVLLLILLVFYLFIETGLHDQRYHQR